MYLGLPHIPSKKLNMQAFISKFDVILHDKTF